MVGAFERLELGIVSYQHPLLRWLFFVQLLISLSKEIWKKWTVKGMLAHVASQIIIHLKNHNHRDNYAFRDKRDLSELR
jgi:hypothetical protein